ncbi:GAF and ANTAR domain-containing protein [Amycolatopsis coloradensis]|uniref:GAF and ANTAR domain-containing protein n=1 Tax=Amycolatopsis coloradensis TaxID=76021 RepID=A0ACD5BDY3_9PSEU
MNREQRLADALVELSDTLVKDFDVAGQLDRLAARCTELFDITAAAVMLASEDARRWTSATSGSHADLFDVLALARLEGPVLDCCRAGIPIGPVGWAGARRRWPAFASAAAKAGYRQMCSVPMRSCDEILGAVLLLHSESDPRPMSEIRLMQTLVDAAAIGLVHEREIRRQTELSAQLQTALHSRVLIEQAKGILAVRRDTSVDEAFELMRGHARRYQRRIGDVARHVVAHRALPAIPPKTREQAGSSAPEQDRTGPQDRSPSNGSRPPRP